MFKNHLKIAWRNLLKHRQFTFLNLAGLSTGLACALLIWLWVSSELRVDKFFEKNDQLFQVMHNPPLANGGVFTTEHTPGPLAGALVKEMPDVEDAATVVAHGAIDDAKGVISIGDMHIKAREIYATRNFFNLFSYRLFQGDKTGPLSDKYGVLLSRELALKLFHTTENIIGRKVEWERTSRFGKNVNGPFQVSGVFEAPPANATMQFDVLFSYDLYFDANRSNLDNWGSSNPSTYVILKKGVNTELFNSKIRDFMRNKWKAEHGEQDLKWIGTLFAQRYSDRYLNGRYENGAPAGGRIDYIKLFSIIAIFILVIACINFMNLSTAKASGRMKEVGIRKVAGARRGALIGQYLGESMLMAFLSMLIAIGLVWLVLPVFSRIAGTTVRLDLSPSLLIAALGIPLVTGLIAGSYPALYLSGFRPAQVLKGRLISSAGELWVRKGLVVFQFVLSATLIVSVLVVYRQMKLIQTQNLGYNKDNVIHFSSEGRLQQSLETFLSDLKSIPGVVNASSMNGDLVGNHSSGGGISWPGKTPGADIEFSGSYVDYDFIETMGLKMQQGHAYSRTFGSDTTGVIFNESAIAAMGLKDPVGKTVKMWGHDEHIIGVVKDFNFESLYKKVSPFFFRFLRNNNNVLVKIGAGKENETIPRIAKVYRQYNLGLPLEYKFMDADFQALYASEQRVAVLSRCFAGLTILISCLGLFGLAAFTAQKRQKEIGIRKVVGATVSHIALMLSTDFLKLVLIAVLIAFPLSWWGMNHWLNGFAYRAPIGAGAFLLAGASILLITLLTISFQSLRAALANPVKSLRTE